MVEQPPSLALGQESGERFQEGDRVRIVLGVLSGLVGVVARRTSNHKYLLNITGLPDGVHVVVSGFALERVASA